MRPRAVAHARAGECEERCAVEKHSALPLYTKDAVFPGSPLLFAPRCLHPAEVPNALVRQEGTRTASLHGWGCCVGEHQPGRTLKMPSLVATYSSHLQLQRPDCSLRAAPRKLLPRAEALPGFGSYSGALVPHQADTSPHLTAQVSDSSPTPRERRNSSPTPRERRPSDPSPMQRRASLMSGSPFRRERRTSLTGSPTRRERRASNSSPSRRERRTSFSGDPLEEVTRMVSNPWPQRSRMLLAQCSTPCNRAHPACGRMKTRWTTRFPRRQ